MNKTVIKNFAIEARKSLLQMVTDRAALLGITYDGKNVKIDAASEKGSDYEIFTSAGGINTILTPSQSKQRENLVRKVKANYEATMEEAAYTWFNRIIAIRFMEVNDYLPSRIRVLSSETPGKTEPDLVTVAPNVDELNLSAKEKETIIELKGKNKLDELFQFLFVKQCNELNKILPELFESTKTSALDYTELLLNLRYTDANGVVRKIQAISEDDFKEAVEIIGWLYQYYITEQNALLYDGSMSREKIKKELLPAATQLFTPDWPIRYMVDNTLGKILFAKNENSAIKNELKYYLDDVEEQNSKTKEEFNKIENSYKLRDLREIKFLDPCMGSGHILVYAFEVYMQFYILQGYRERDAVREILENNIYGLDIDKRAYQLAWFALMMKAREHNRKAFDENYKINVYHIQESNSVDITPFVNDPDFKLSDKNLSTLRYLKTTYDDAKEYGSILKIEKRDFCSLVEELESILPKATGSLVGVLVTESIHQLINLCKQAEIMCKNYDVIVTNPPYLGSSRFSNKLSGYVNNNYEMVKSDLSMVMFKHVLEDMLSENGFASFITTTSWMVLISFEEWRKELLTNYSFDSICDFGSELFEGKIGHLFIASCIVRKTKIKKSFKCIRLVEYCYAKRDQKKSEFFEPKNYYVANQDNFSKIPGTPIAYWVTNAFLKMFENKFLSDYAEVITGMTIGDNKKYLRLWFEPNYQKLALNKQSMAEINLKQTNWIPYSKGGDRRNWYGNYDYVVNWAEKDNFNRPKTTMQHLYLREALTWPFISTSFSARILPKGSLWDVAGSPCFFKDKKIQSYAHGFMCTKIADEVLKVINPTINVQAIDVSHLPLKIDESKIDSINLIVNETVEVSRMDWDSFETSWDFKLHPFVRLVLDASDAKEFFKDSSSHSFKLADVFEQWQDECKNRFNTVKANEEELNRIFIEIYGLQDELSPEVADKDVTVHTAELERDVRSLISYVVGCMLGRYSLYTPGIAYAGGNLDVNKYGSFGCDNDNVIPVTDKEYFKDDIVSGFVRFIRTVFGEATLEENLKFIADALGTKGDSPRQKIRQYFMNDFYKDHIKIYQKRPIYWMFDSGKENGFKALVYVHRYDKETCARVRTDYLFKQQKYLENALVLAQKILENPISTAGDKKEAMQDQARITKQLAELKLYDQALSHISNQYIEIDLDDGVNVNYEKFQNVVVSRKDQGQKDVTVNLLGDRK